MSKPVPKCKRCKVAAEEEGPMLRCPKCGLTVWTLAWGFQAVFEPKEIKLPKAQEEPRALSA